MVDVARVEPFKDKTASEMADVLTRKGYVPKGPDAGAGNETFVNGRLEIGRVCHIDAKRANPDGPPIGVHRPRELRDVMKPRDYPMKGP